MSRSTSSPTDTLAGLGRLGAVAQNPSLAGALTAARELLGMGLSYVTRHTDEEQVFLHVDGDAASFGVGAGAASRWRRPTASGSSTAACPR